MFAQEMVISTNIVKDRTHNSCNKKSEVNLVQVNARILLKSVIKYFHFRLLEVSSLVVRILPKSLYDNAAAWMANTTQNPKIW